MMRFVPTYRIAALLVILSSVSACGGSSGGNAAGALLPAASTSAGTFSLFIPSAQNTHIRRQDISPSAQSASILVGSLAAQIADISATSPLCTTGTAGRTCNVRVNAPVGNDTFTIAIFDGPNATGNKLGIATLSIVVSGPGFSGNATVGGVVASVVLSLANPNLPAGTAGSTTLSVVARDADENIIIGPYANPVSISVTGSGVTVSPSQITQSSQTATVTYDGSQTSNVSITATGGASISASTTLSPTSAAVWIQTPTTGPFYIKQGNDGAIYFSEFGPSGTIAPPFFVGPLNPGKIARIDPASHAITEAPTGIGPDGFTFASDGSLWNVNAQDNTIEGRANFSAAPTVVTVPTVNSLPRQITLGPDGKLWFTELFGNKVGTFSEQTPGNITEYTIPTTTGRPSPIVSGPDGNLWVGETGQSNGVPKLAKLTPGGSFTEYNLPTTGTYFERFMAVSSDGKFYITEAPEAGAGTAAGTVTRSTTSGVMQQLALPTLADPEGVTAGTGGTVYITDFYWASVGQISPGGEVTLWPLLPQSQAASSTLVPQEIAFATDGSLWFTGGSSQLTPQTSYVGHLVLGQGWNVFPQGAITLSSTGSSTQQLIGIAETGDSSPFTVTSDKPQVVSVAPVATSTHNFMLSGIAAGGATVTVTDKNNRAVQIAVTVK